MSSFFESLPVNPLDVSSSGLHAQRIRMNTIANNLANVNTTRNDKGFREVYRKKEVLFKTGAPDQTGHDRFGVRVKDVRPDLSSELRREYQPDHPDADKNGYVWLPNVRVPLEMIDMIEASRSYEANLTAIQVSKDMAQKSLNLLS